MNAGRIFYKVKELLVFNDGVEKVYLEAMEAIDNEDLKRFFKERSEERQKFSLDLKAEMDIIEEKSDQPAGLSSNFYEIWRNFRNLVAFKDETGLLSEIYRLKLESVDMYNQLLMEPNLDLSTCKLLEKQRDDIQSSIQALTRELDLAY
ncbi:DUF2383 domain-containing protein [Aestuariibaculum sediminum]|uniref:DUF2383 domain-containing protein n=1 Tax=Aestuariibaculum sediminum TaxID=2770637 RepID=A0A8J6UEQ2_9FLAO|nr:DUF2383 domain-containing protein [Aestuariibaculum sediminum]MBD0830911.1 DUF2383 domain-containing protein [Aestuariibaculum sediminum]